MLASRLIAPPMPLFIPRTSALLAVLLTVGLLTGCSKEAKKARLLKQADADYQQGEYDKAQIEYLNLLRLDRSDPTPYERLGRIWFEEGAPLRAAPYLLKSRELDPKNVASRIRLARVFVAIGQRDQAIQEALSVLKQSPGTGDALVVMAEAAQTAEQRAHLDEQLRTFPNRNDASFQLATATVAIQKRDRESAEKALQRALKLDPRSPVAHSFMAGYWLLNREPKKAREELKTAAELAPLRSAERLNYAKFKAQSGAVDDAIASLHSITKAAPDYLPAWSLLAQLAFARGKYDESLKLLENIFNRDAENFDASVLRGKAWLAKGQKDKAIESFQRLAEKYPKFAPLKYELARCYLEKQDMAQAAGLLNQAITVDPNFVEAILLLGQLNLRQGNAQLAADSMRGLLKKKPDLLQARLLLADAYRSLGRLDDAADIFREQIKSSPKNAGAYLALGMILLQQKKATEGREALEKAVELAPNNPMAILQLTDSYLAARDFNRASEFAQQQVSRTPNSALAHFVAAKVYAAQSKWSLAEGDLTKALSLDPNFAPAYTLLSATYLATDRLADASKELETLVSKKPHDIQALLTLGIVSEKLKNFSKARQAYEKLLSFAPKFAPALNNLACLYAAHFDQVEQAYQLAQKAHALKPEDPSMADTLGWILYQKQQYEQALVLLQESADKSPNEAEILYHLGMAHYMMGHREAAQTALNKSLQVAPNFSDAGEARRRLLFLSDNSSGAASVSIEDLKRAVSQQPNDIIALTRLGDAYEKQKAFKEAAEAYEKVLDRNPKLLPVMMKLARIYAGPLGDGQKALELTKRARDVAPNDRDVAALLGQLAYQTGNFSWAYSLLEESARQFPDKPEIHYQLSWAAFSLGKLDETRSELERVVALASGSSLAADAKRFLDMISLFQDPKKALSQAVEIVKVLNQDPNYSPAELAQAAVETARGNLKAAAGIYERILEKFPDFAVGQKYLAEVYLAEGSNVSKAYDLAMKARKALPDDAEVANTLAEISFQRKEYPRALELLQESARKQTLDAKHLYYLGVCSFQTKHSLEARQALDQALANGLQDPFASDARRVLADLARN